MDNTIIYIFLFKFNIFLIHNLYKFFFSIHITPFKNFSIYKKNYKNYKKAQKKVDYMKKYTNKEIIEEVNKLENIIDKKIPRRINPIWS